MQLLLSHTPHAKQSKKYDLCLAILPKGKTLLFVNALLLSLMDNAVTNREKNEVA
jgi:hypothetical protein